MTILTDTQIHWDNKTADYDLVRYDWPAWALSVIQEVAPQVRELETMHEVLSAEEIVAVSNHVQNACTRRDFMQRFDAFAAEIAQDRVAGRRYMVQRQGTLRVVVPNQSRMGRRLAFHQGIFVGNGRGCRTIWTPFTEARNTNTMWIMDLERSREITKQVLDQKWSLERFEDECLRHAWPVNLKPGQSHLFFQEHLHGNVENQEGYTRVSLDMRLLLEGEEYGRRLPGGFMRLPGDHEVADVMDYTGRHLISYSGWNSRFSKHIPLPMQRSVIDQYCSRHSISYSSYEFENEHMDWQPGLEHYIRLKLDGIVLSSMYSLTDDVVRRNELLELALDQGVELHFANEACSLKDRSDLQKIQTYLDFAVPKSGPYVWENV